MSLWKITTLLRSNNLLIGVVVDVFLGVQQLKRGHKYSVVKITLQHLTTRNIPTLTSFKCGTHTTNYIYRCGLLGRVAARLERCKELTFCWPETILCNLSPFSELKNFFLLTPFV